MVRILYRFIVSIFLLAFIWLSGLIAFTLQIPSEQITPSTPADAVIVLTGGAGRIDHGLKRVKDGYAKQIFISGVNDEATSEHIIHQTIKGEKSYAQIKESGQLSLGYRATSTIGNAEEVKKWITDHHIKTILLVTANYHMPRSLVEFRFVMPENLEIVPDPVIPAGFDLAEWWRMGNSTRLIFNEYHKWLAAHLRHALILWHKS